MAYGNLLADVVQSSVTGSPTVFKDGAGTETGTLCRAWVNFNGAGGTIRSSFNVSSITVSTAGQYVVNFTNALADTNYSAIVSSGTGGSNCPNINAPSTAPTTTTFTFQTFDYSFGALSAWTYNYVAVYR